jgi:hypothetical protein
LSAPSTSSTATSPDAPVNGNGPSD